VGAIEDSKSSFRNSKDDKNQSLKASSKRSENSESAPPKKKGKIFNNIIDEKDKKIGNILTIANNNNNAINFEDLYDKKKEDEYVDKYLIDNKIAMNNNNLENKERKILQNARLSLKTLDENDLEELEIKFNPDFGDNNTYSKDEKNKNAFFRKKNISFDNFQNSKFLCNDDFIIKNNAYYKTQPNNIDLSKSLNKSNLILNEQSEFTGDELPKKGTNNNNINENNNINDNDNDNCDKNVKDNDKSKQNSDDNSHFKDNDYDNKILCLNNKKNDNEIIENSGDIFLEHKKIKSKKNGKINYINRTEYFDTKKKPNSSNNSNIRNRRNNIKTSLINSNSTLRIMNIRNISNDNILDGVEKNKINNSPNNNDNINKNLIIIKT
jgi:hypothetical protein